jgi:site-specific DNA-methyltransferase (adenine-specific)
MDFLPTVPDHSVDLVLVDLPYGTSRNKWDSVLDLDALWTQWWRILKANGVVVLTAAQPFTSVLVCSDIADFKIEWIWKKTIGSGQLNISHQPLRMHESVLVFYRRKPIYNEQQLPGKPYTIERKATFEGPGYNQQQPSAKVNSGFRHANTVLSVANPRIKGGHPTQKPVELFEYFIKTYSNEGDLVLDHCIGAGTAAVAAIRTGRRYIGVELDADYFKMAQVNVARELAALKSE